MNLVACPSCSRQEFDVISTVNALEQRLEDITDSIDVAVIGCIVNGPGEAREAEIGIVGGKRSLLYKDGKPDYKVNNDALLDELEQAIRERLRKRREAGESPEAPLVVSI